MLGVSSRLVLRVRLWQGLCHVSLLPSASSWYFLQLVPHRVLLLDCVNVLTLTSTEVPGRAAVLMMRSMTIAQVGQDRDMSRYNFSHIISIASLQAF